MLMAGCHPAGGTKVFAAVESDNVPTAARGCVPGTVGLVEAETATWVPHSCTSAKWADDALTSSTLDSGEVIVYAVPGGGDDTYLMTINFNTSTEKKAIVGGDQGELLCLSLRDAPNAMCYGVSPVSGSTPTQLMEVDSKSGTSKPVLNLKHYVGYSVGSSVIDPANRRYHAVLVGRPHSTPSTSYGPRGNALRTPKLRCGSMSAVCSMGSGSPRSLSNQYLVTIDLATMTVSNEVPVGADFMGPLSVSTAHGLATFGSDIVSGFVAVNYSTGHQKQLIDQNFGTVVQFSGANSRNYAYAVSVYPHPPHFFALDLTGGRTPTVSVNAVFNTSVHALSSCW